jgi:hypothetical protein
LFAIRSAKRFAQDDDFVGELAIQLVGYAGARKIEKVTGSRRSAGYGFLKLWNSASIVAVSK